MQRIIRVIDVITILSSLSFLAYCAADVSRLGLSDVVWWVLIPLSILIRVFGFTDQRWQLVADRMVVSTLVIQGLAECHEQGFAGSGDDLKKYIFTLVLNSSIILVRGRLFRLLLSVPVLSMFIAAVLDVPGAPICLLTSVVGCIWRQHLTATPPIQI